MTIHLQALGCIGCFFGEYCRSGFTNRARERQIDNQVEVLLAVRAESKQAFEQRQPETTGRVRVVRNIVS